ncbi:MAG: DUF1350 family protein [Cyanobacteria bacterium REEB459]|nr:DUF1350 family protein [Cyanobacteria bacterium REEB459]
MEWQQVSGNWILAPAHPIAILHFLGGAFVATAPSLTYGWLLENLAQAGYLVVATPFLNGLDHEAMAETVLRNFIQAQPYLQTRARLPVYGLGHSMGCKLHLLINSLWEVERAGNIYISFNNYPAQAAIPLLEQLGQLNSTFNVEFTPSPSATLALVAEDYPVSRNLLIKFRSDNLDQTRSLSEVLIRRFPHSTAVRILPGSHTTPIAQDVAWQPGQAFTPLDVLGQFLKQEWYRDLQQLKQDLLSWLESPGRGS